MTERAEKRFARRLQVKFWARGEPRPVSAYTTNISATGMFVGTSSPLKPRSRLRIEVLHGEHGFIVEGVVVHAARVSPLLRRLKSSGMGVRFLSVQELIAELLPAASVAPEAPADPEPDQAAATGERPLAEAVAEPPATKEAAPDATPPLDDSPSVPGSPAPPQRLELRHERTYRLRFSSLPSFLVVLEQDIRNGGIFVPTRQPAPPEERVTVEIHVPPPIDRVLPFSGRVVHQAGEPDGTDNLLAGVGVEFVDPEGVIEKIRSVIYSE